MPTAPLHPANGLCHKCLRADNWDETVLGAWCFVVLRSQGRRRSTKHEARSTKHEARSTKHEARSTTHQAPMRLLLVEDDAKMANMLARSLREQGYAVDIVHDGERAESQSNINDYDGLVLDV